MRASVLSALAITVLAWGVAPAQAVTGRDLSSRFTIDGYTSDFTSDETVFGLTPNGWAQESIYDSKYYNLEVDQVRISWDSNRLYVAVEGVLGGHNMMLLMDTVPGRGLMNMDSLNSWRRNIQFDTNGRFAGDEFEPDVFGATWDTNLSPRFLTALSTIQVDDHVAGPEFSAAASFDGVSAGRAMEFSIPWRNVFAGLAGIGTRDTLMVVDGVSQVIHRMPPGVHSIKLAAVATGAWDGSGSPDAAPDTRSRLSSYLDDPATIDNYAIIDLDRDDDTGTGNGGPDGVPDWNAIPSERVSFRYLPPIIPGLTDVGGARGGQAVAALAAQPNPAHGGCRFRVDLASDATAVCAVYAVDGRLIHALRAGAWSRGTHVLDWDGAASNGQPAPAGIYYVEFRSTTDRMVRPIVLLR